MVDTSEEFGGTNFCFVFRTTLQLAEMETDVPEFKPEIDINVRIIQAVECYPLLYKGSASILERQRVWENISKQLEVPTVNTHTRKPSSSGQNSSLVSAYGGLIVEKQMILKSRWHILCAYFQRYLEKRRSTDEEQNGGVRTGFKYENEMEFMLPYMHARIAIAAANEARKQQELAAANGNNDLTDPEFVITQTDLEHATRISSNINDQYAFYDVETLDDDTNVQHYQQQHDMDGNNIGMAGNYDNDDHFAIDDDEQKEFRNEISEEVIEELDESENIIIQDVIVDGSEIINENCERILMEEDEMLQMDDQIETAIEEIVENTPSIDSEIQLPTHTAGPFEEIQQTVFIHGNDTRRIIHIPVGMSDHRLSRMINKTNSELSFTHASISSASSTAAAIIPLGLHQHHQQQQQQQQQQLTHNQHQQNEQNQHQQIVKSAPSIPQEYAIMTRRRRAIVLKATPRVQVELTDNAANSIGDTEADIKVTPPDVAANAEVSECRVLAINASATVHNNGMQQNTPQQYPPPLQQHNHHQQQQQQQAIYQQNHHHQYEQQRQSQQQRTNNRQSQYERFDSSSDQDNRSNDSNLVSTTAAVENEDDQPSKTNERNEDTIFGELVTAMLKTMPRERKRTIKKSIMDLLLT